MFNKLGKNIGALRSLSFSPTSTKSLVLSSKLPRFFPPPDVQIFAYNMNLQFLHIWKKEKKKKSNAFFFFSLCGSMCKLVSYCHEILKSRSFIILTGVEKITKLKKNQTQHSSSSPIVFCFAIAARFFLSLSSIYISLR